MFEYSKILLLALVLYGCLYFLLPELFLHFLGLGSWKRHYSPGVSLTFDDGPDPIYTVKLLDILEKHRIKACFFLVGEKAEQHPDLTKKILEKGHQIGTHGYLHKHAWLLSPTKTWYYWNESIRILKKIVGSEPEFIRPPWGGFNLALFIWALVKKKKIIMWSVKAFDWKKNRTPSDIVNTIIKNSAEGGIILLHDSGGEIGAPTNTLLCLEKLIKKLKTELKLPVVPLKIPEWPLFRRLIYRLWQKWEKAYANWKNIRRIDDQSLFRLALVKYKGPNLVNEWGQILAKKGDLIGEIHFDNSRFPSMDTDTKNIGISALKKVRFSLPILANYVAHNPDFKSVNVYLGVTMLNKGAKNLGFSVQEYPFKDGRLIAALQKILIKIYHPLGAKRKTAKLGFKPKLVWITRDQLLKKYYKTKKTN